MRNFRIRVLVFLAAFICFALVKGYGKEEVKTAAPIYVGAYSVDHEFGIVTEECMEILKTKKILYGSRSWGLVIGSYISRQKDFKTKLTWEGTGNKRVNSKDMVLTDDVFKEPKILNFIFDSVPKRWQFFDDFIRKEPWSFGKKIDGGLQTLYYIGDKESMDEAYFPILDGLIRDYPNVKFAISTHNVGASGMDLRGKEQPEASDWNVRGGDFSEKVIKKYYGKIAIFDMRDIVSTRPDGTVCSFEHKGKTYRKLCPEYNSNKDLIHPNTPEAQARMGKGFLILLTKMFCADKIPRSLVTPKPDILK